MNGATIVVSGKVMGHREATGRSGVGLRDGTSAPLARREAVGGESRVRSVCSVVAATQGVRIVTGGAE